MGGPEMAPHTPPTLVAPRRSRGAPRPPTLVAPRRSRGAPRPPTLVAPRRSRGAPDGVRLSAGHGRPQHVPLAAPRARPRSRRGVPRRRARRVPPPVRPDRDRPAPRRRGVARARARGLRPSARFDTLARRGPRAMKTLVHNIGTLVSGHIRRPLLDADALVIRDGRIVAVGRGLDEDADTVIDARGTTVLPGLIDWHGHPVFGDFTPRQ